MPKKAQALYKNGIHPCGEVCEIAWVWCCTMQLPSYWLKFNYILSVALICTCIWMILGLSRADQGHNSGNYLMLIVKLRVKRWALVLCSVLYYSLLIWHSDFFITETLQKYVQASLLQKMLQQCKKKKVYIYYLHFNFSDNYIFPFAFLWYA